MERNKPTSSHLQSQEYAWHGIFKIFDHEHNFRIELIVAAFAVIISYLLGISPSEFGIIFLCIGFVLAMEAINGVVELMCDIISLEIRKDIEYAKDATAGAVLISAITTAVVGFLIWAPYLIAIIQSSR